MTDEPTISDEVKGFRKKLAAEMGIPEELLFIHPTELPTWKVDNATPPHEDLAFRKTIMGQVVPLRLGTFDIRIRARAQKGANRFIDGDIYYSDHYSTPSLLMTWRTYEHLWRCVWRIDFPSEAKRWKEMGRDEFYMRMEAVRPMLYRHFQDRATIASLIENMKTQLLYCAQAYPHDEVLAQAHNVVQRANAAMCDIVVPWMARECPAYRITGLKDDQGRAEGMDVQAFPPRDYVAGFGGLIHSLGDVWERFAIVWEPKHVTTEDYPHA